MRINKSVGIAVLFTAIWSVSALGEDKTCTVVGPHCEGCVSSVKERVCTEGSVYSTCEGKIVDEEKKIGEFRFVTKDPSAKIDEKALAKLISTADIEYKLKKCVTTAKTPAGKAKKG